MKPCEKATERQWKATVKHIQERRIAAAQEAQTHYSRLLQAEALLKFAHEESEAALTLVKAVWGIRRSSCDDEFFAWDKAHETFVAARKAYIGATGGKKVPRKPKAPKAQPWRCECGHTYENHHHAPLALGTWTACQKCDCRNFAGKHKKGRR